MNIDFILKKLNINKNDYIVVGVSAGPDSMALLHILKNTLKNKIVCAHINHNIRKESTLEANYLKQYCKDNDIIFEYLEIKTYKENNLENEARKKRYVFFEEILKKYNSKYLFLAHHGDDLIETVLMKIARGSNLEGYAGIKTYSKLENYTIVRPLLKYTKKDIIKYNDTFNIKYYIDNTNEDINYTRNRYRKNILPLLKKEDDEIHLKFIKYSETLQEYYNYIEKIIIEKINKDHKNNEINLEAFNKEDIFIKKNIVFYILSNIYNNESNIIKDSHILSIISLAENNKPNSSVNLPDKFYAIKEYDKIIFKKKNNQDKDYKIEFSKDLVINNFRFKLINNCSDNGNNICKLNSKEIALPLYFRNKKEGDYIEILGLNGKKKVKDIFIDEKIPIDKRKTYPLLVDANDNILWIPNLKKSKYNVKNNELCDIILTSYEEREEINEKEK